MALKKEKRPIRSINPRTLLLYGAPKVGKTTVLSQLEDCLVIDTEQGSDMLEGYFVGITNRRELLNFYKEAQTGHEYTYFALDTVDKVVEWTERSICDEYQVTTIGEVGTYGLGWQLVRQKVMANIDYLLELAGKIIVVGHRKIAASIDNSTAVDPESLDLSGKLKNQLMSKMDAVGYMFRDPEDNNLMVSFKGEQALEAGSRCNHLKGQIFPFDWNKIYKEEK